MGISRAALLAAASKVVRHATAAHGYIGFGAPSPEQIDANIILPRLVSQTASTTQCACKIAQPFDTPGRAQPPLFDYRPLKIPRGATNESIPRIDCIKGSDFLGPPPCTLRRMSRRFFMLSLKLR